MSACTPYPAAVAELIQFYETLRPESLARLPALYAPDARFKDPFNDVQGVDAVQRIMEHLFDALQQPRFRVLSCVAQGQQAFVTWDFEFALPRLRNGQTQRIHGATHWALDAAGRVTLHRDYWDAAEELYEKLPILGALMRTLKAALRTPQKPEPAR
ncbi:MAG: nuclear transport factor 2 family protein [Rhodoferax sp.]